jgi:hypothetical protein
MRAVREGRQKQSVGEPGRERTMLGARLTSEREQDPVLAGLADRLLAELEQLRSLLVERRVAADRLGERLVPSAERVEAEQEGGCPAVCWRSRSQSSQSSCARRLGSKRPILASSEDSSSTAWTGTTFRRTSSSSSKGRVWNSESTSRPGLAVRSWSKLPPAAALQPGVPRRRPTRCPTWWG